MDDITLAGDIRTVEADVNTVIHHDADTGLKLNISKCENTTAIPDSSILSKFVKVAKDEMTMLALCWGHQSSKDQLRMLL